MKSLPALNALLVRYNVGNLKRVVLTVDQSEASEKIAVLPLKNSMAERVAGIVARLFQKQGAVSESGLRIVVLNSPSVLLLRGNENQVNQALRIVREVFDDNTPNGRRSQRES